MQKFIDFQLDLEIEKSKKYLNKIIQIDTQK